ncbi:hypothetical protein DVH24_018133 [Malus domestica]|uniref:Glycerol-3-phosphate dehydrogenase NAD-dependent N-terminal domain-containing protein n=1 Tax=Malus domestica TaxID=3750 RepID=A0A498KFV3_MALDO|nr:hypothetical protein DVH24_018133 [Malus domestica]
MHSITISGTDAMANNSQPRLFQQSVVNHVICCCLPFHWLNLPIAKTKKSMVSRSLRTVSQITPQALKNPREPFIALSVPSFALELMNKLPTAMVVASKDNKLANAAQQLLACDYLRISTSRLWIFSK